MIEVNGLSFSYGRNPVLHNVSLKAERGEFVSLLGSNGAGKSTLFKCILRILPDYSGTVAVDGTDTGKLSARELAKKIAYIPQMSASAFNYSVEDIVLMGTTAGLSSLRSPGAAELRCAEEAMERVGIASLRNRCFHHLSGGEKQLTVIARALAQKADILLLDEPGSALDFGNQLRILSVAKSLAEEGFLVIQSTHDLERAYLFSDRMIALKDSTVFAQGTPAEVLTEENIRELYGVDTLLTSIHNDRVRVFTPRSTI